MNKLLFFCFASAILLFSIIVINISPIIHGLNQTGFDMSTSCQYYSDDYNEKKDSLNDEQKKEAKKPLNRCNRQHAMEGLEYTSLILNLVIGFICALLGYLNYMNLGNIGKISGLIGLGGGAVGFVLTLVYVIESGLVFDDRANLNNYKLAIDSDGAFLEWSESKNSYVCIFYDKDNQDSIYLKFSNYGNKYLSYNKDIFFSNENKYDDVPSGCNYYNQGTASVGNAPNSLGINWANCKEVEEGNKKINDGSNNKINNCDKLYFFDKTNRSNQNKIIFDKWLTSIIFSCFIFLFDIGLALFGFLIFRESNGSSGKVEIK